MATDRSVYREPTDPAAFEIARQLDASPHHELRHVRVEIVDGVIVLRGIVSSFYIKQLAQETVRQVRPHRQVSNELVVR